MSFRIERFALAPSIVFAALWVARVLRSGETTYGFVLWNLGLAAVPAIAALWIDTLARRGATVAAFAVAAGWLAFLPNAPYVLTDLVHLRERPGAPLWFDVGIRCVTHVCEDARAGSVESSRVDQREG